MDEEPIASKPGRRERARLSRHGQVPAIAVLIDALDDAAMGFYRRFEDIQPLPENSPTAIRRLFIPMRVVEQL